MAKTSPFSNGNHVVYPAHGIGQIRAIETQEVAGHSLEMFVISFEKDRMTLRLPVAKAQSAGLRPICTNKEIATAINALKTKGRVGRKMWSRRAQEYEAKINSGNPISLAEVVRELYRTATQPEQSYSERQVYQSALSRLAGEVAVIEKINPDQAIEKIEAVLEAA